VVGGEKELLESSATTTSARAVGSWFKNCCRNGDDFDASRRGDYYRAP
jgi:hypothetical protein